MGIYRHLFSWIQWYFYYVLPLIICVVLLSYHHINDQDMASSESLDSKNRPTHSKDEMIYYNKEEPLVWITGFKKSGMGLMRELLEVHPDVRCADETKFINRQLGWFHNLIKSPFDSELLMEAKIKQMDVAEAVAAYILSILALSGESTPRLCNKDMFSLRYSKELMEMFPKSKFLVVARDARPNSYSLTMRGGVQREFRQDLFQGSMRNWDQEFSQMYEACQSLGPDTCLVVHYERLVLDTKSQMTEIMQFLGLPYTSDILQNMQDKDEKLLISKYELATDQFENPVWLKYFTDDLKKQMRAIAPVMQKLGYDMDSYPPDYGNLVESQQQELD